MATCRTCEAAIVWAHTSSGKAMPLDAKPCEDGDLEIVDGLAVKVGLFTPPGGPRWKSHFATCPQAKAHRRRA